NPPKESAGPHPLSEDRRCSWGRSRPYAAGMLGTVPVIVLGVVVLVDVLRVFLPSLITVFGSAGSTPPELIGLYALAWFVAAFLAVLVARFAGARVVALSAAALLAAARLGLQFTDGGSAQ